MLGLIKLNTMYIDHQWLIQIFYWNKEIKIKQLFKNIKLILNGIQF